MQSRTKIMLVDDHPLVREWLANLIKEEPDFEVCGSVGNAREALGLLSSLWPETGVF
jgi:DNA-binding NarL/FixJ family response regulator